MCTFFKVQTGLNGQVDSAAKGHQVRLSRVYNYCRLLLTVFAIWRTSTTAGITTNFPHSYKFTHRNKTKSLLRVVHVAVWTNHILQQWLPKLHQQQGIPAGACTQGVQVRFPNILQACRPSTSLPSHLCNCSDCNIVIQEWDRRSVTGYFLLLQYVNGVGCQRTWNFYIWPLLSKDISKLFYLRNLTESNESMTVEYTFIYIVENTIQVRFVIVTTDSTRDFTASVRHNHQKTRLTRDQCQLRSDNAETHEK